MDNIRQFVDIQALYERNPGAATEQCREFLNSGERFVMVRRGDVYGFLVEHFTKQGQFKQVIGWV